MIMQNSDYAGTEPTSLDQEDSHIEEHTENPSGDWFGTVQQFIIIVPNDPLVDTITETVITS
jgi:hypothetical protein